MTPEDLEIKERWEREVGRVLEEAGEGEVTVTRRLLVYVFDVLAEASSIAGPRHRAAELLGVVTHELLVNGILKPASVQRFLRHYRIHTGIEPRPDGDGEINILEIDPRAQKN